MNRKILLAIVLLLVLTSVAYGAPRPRTVPLEGTVMGPVKGAYEVYGIDLTAGLGILPRDLYVASRNGKRLGEFVVMWAGPRYSLIVPRAGTHAGLKRGDKLVPAGALAMPRPPPFMPPPGETVWVRERDFSAHMGVYGSDTFVGPTFSGSTQFSGGPTFSLPSVDVPTSFSGSTTFTGPDFSLTMPSIPNTYSGPGWSAPTFSLPATSISP